MMEITIDVREERRKIDAIQSIDDVKEYLKNQLLMEAIRFFDSTKNNTVRSSIFFNEDGGQRNEH